MVGPRLLRARAQPAARRAAGARRARRRVARRASRRCGAARHRPLHRRRDPRAGAAAQRHAILDGNVQARARARASQCEGRAGERARRAAALGSWPSSCTPQQRVAALHAGHHGSGRHAVHAAPARPAQRCPLAAQAAARCARPAARDCPRRASRAARPRARRSCMLLARRDDGSVLLERRPERGIWGGLWCLPEFDARGRGARLAQRRGSQRAASTPSRCARAAPRLHALRPRDHAAAGATAPAARGVDG